MKPKPLGTILPDWKQLAKSDAHEDNQAAIRDAFGRKELPHCIRKIVGGEVRYYDTTDQYAIVSRAGKILWFQVTTDGDYRI